MAKQPKEPVMNQAKLLFLLCTLVLVPIALQADRAQAKLTPAEDYVQQQVAKGEWAI